MNGYCELITGTLGGGKTLYAVERAFEHALKGGWVFSNIPFRHVGWAEAMERRGYIFEPERVVTLTGEQTLEFHRHVPRGTHDRAVMVIIDEAGLEFNARDWAKTSKELLALNTLARKLDIVMLYISQQSADIDKQFRGKCRCEWQCRNMHNIRMFGLFPVKIPLYSRVCYDTTKGKREYLCSDVFTIPKWVFPLYDSDALVGRGNLAVSSLLRVDGTPLRRVERSKRKRQIEFLTWGAFVCGLIAFC